MRVWLWSKVVSQRRRLSTGNSRSASTLQRTRIGSKVRNVPHLRVPAALAVQRYVSSGSPADNVVFYELYNTRAQLAARAHPAILTTQRALLSLWHTNASSGTAPVSLSTPISYFDRLRIRPPGPSAFVLGCHVDGGSLERWEDEGYRRCYERMFHAGEGWRDKDWLFDAGLRIAANPDLHNAP